MLWRTLQTDPFSILDADKADVVSARKMPHCQPVTPQSLIKGLLSQTPSDILSFCRLVGTQSDHVLARHARRMPGNAAGTQKGISPWGTAKDSEWLDCQIV
jgi:hypothetical protein